MRAFFLAAAAAFLLSACAGNVATRDIQMESDIACRAIGASLSALAPHRADLSDSVEATVQRIRVEAEPLCTGDNPPRTVEVANRLTLLAFDLMSAEKEVN